jgi:hypothetical protein
LENRRELAISESRLQRVGAISLVFVILFAALGFIVSPRDEKGQPLLLSPDVKAFQDYREIAQDWRNHLNDIDGEISTILSGTNEGDLFSQSHQTQQMLQNAVELIKGIDQVQVPAVASGIHEQIYSTSMGYLEVARLVMRWVGAPDPTIKEQINAKLDQVRKNKSVLEKNQWINHP